MATDISLKCELYRGLHTRIARRLGLSRSFVWRVANGVRSSPQVQAAIAKELARIQRQAAKNSHQPNSRS